MFRESLGNWLYAQRSKSGGWFWALIAFLGLLVLANVFVHPHHPHFGLDAYPGFWAVFGFGGAVIMVAVLKKLVAPLLARPEDCYDRDQ